MKRIHVAIMKKSWKLTEKILVGSKTIESRWYQCKHPPWDRISAGDDIYFKDSGQLVTLKASVKKVMQFEDLTPKKVWSLLKRFGQQDGIASNDQELKSYFELFKNKRYCIIIFLQNVQKIKPFTVDKSGFGAMSAWLIFDKIKHKPSKLHLSVS